MVANRSIPPILLMSWIRTVTPVTIKMAPHGMALKALSSSPAPRRIKTVPTRNPPNPMSSLKKNTPMTQNGYSREREVLLSIERFHIHFHGCQKLRLPHSASTTSSRQREDKLRRRWRKRNKAIHPQGKSESGHAHRLREPIHDHPCDGYW